MNSKQLEQPLTTSNGSTDRTVKTAIDYEQEELDQWVREYIDESSSLEDFETFFRLNNQEWVRVERAARFNRRNKFDTLDETFWNQDWVKTSGVPRLCHSLVSQLNCTAVEPLKYKQLLDEFFHRSAILISDLLPKIFEIIDPVLNCTWNLFKKCPLKHRNVCLILVLILDCCEQRVVSETREQIVDYFVRIIEECDLMETVIYAVVGLERLYLKKNGFNDDLRKRLIAGLYKLTSHLNDNPLLKAKSAPTSFDPYQYQVGLASSWFLNHILLGTSGTPATAIPPVKLSPNCFSSRCDTTKLFTVRSAFPVPATPAAVYYFEVLLLTAGPIRIGWTVKETQLREYSLLGDHAQSIAFDGYTRALWRDGRQYPVEMDTHWAVGDVVGVEVDTAQLAFRFYLNGQPIQVKGGTSLVAQAIPPYYAAVLLFPYQQVYFNFGQHPFHHAPSESIVSFHSAAPNNSIRYRLAESTFADICHTGKDFAYFSDYNQDYFNRLVAHYSKTSSNKNLEESELCEPKLLKSPHSVLRLAQYVINRPEKEIPELYSHYSDLFALYLAKADAPKGEVVRSLLEMLDSLINPYLDLYRTDWAKHRNVCFIWLVLLEQCADQVPEEICRQLMDYFVRLLERCDLAYQQTLLYALLDVEVLLLRVKHFDVINEETRRRIIDACCRLATGEPTDDSMAYQVAFCARWLLDPVLLPSRTYLPHVKLSTDRLSARADDISLRSTICSKYKVTAGVYYYEVTLLTGGPVRIGWTSKLADSAAELLDSESICFDGFLGRVWHNGTSVQLNETRSKAGDVVGTLLDLTERQIIFYLNGQMSYQVYNCHSSASAYFAAAVLFPHQHVTFNFGQLDFQFPPNDANFTTFHNESLALTAFQMELLQHELDDTEAATAPSFDRFLAELEVKIVEPFHDKKYFLAFPDKLHSLVTSTPSDILQLFRSIIANFGSSIVDDQKVDVFVRLIEKHTVQSADHCTILELFWFAIDRLERLRSAQEHTIVRPRNFCLVLYLIASMLATTRTKCINLLYFYTKLAPLANLILWESTDLWAKLFLVNTFKLLAAQCLPIQQRLVGGTSEDDQILRTKLEVMVNKDGDTWTGRRRVGDLYRDDVNTVAFQLGTVCGELFDQLAGANRLDSSLEHRFAIEPDRLTIRCDTDAQTYRSSFAVPKTGVYYFEVILLTSGSMRIGWATADSQLDFFNLGHDQNSIGLDLHKRYIWHDGRQYRVKDVPCWKAGDVIGCLINVNTRRFTFSHNGTPIDIKWRVFRRFHLNPSQPYHIAVTLTAHQQVAFNFGLAPYAHAPKGIPDTSIINGMLEAMTQKSFVSQTTADNTSTFYVPANAEMVFPSPKHCLNNNINNNNNTRLVDLSSPVSAEFQHPLPLLIN